MKHTIVRDSIKQTSISCPSSWNVELTDGRSGEIHFRTGRLEFRVERRLEASSERDGFDVSSYMDLEEALKLLCSEGIGTTK